LNPFQTEYTTSFTLATGDSVGNIINATAGQGVDVNTSYDGLTIRTVSGTFTGTATIYGWVF
jgi:hypothetical protein